MSAVYDRAPHRQAGTASTPRRTSGILTWAASGHLRPWSSFQMCRAPTARSRREDALRIAPQTVLAEGVVHRQFAFTARKRSDHLSLLPT